MEKQQADNAIYEEVHVANDRFEVTENKCYGYFSSKIDSNTKKVSLKKIYVLLFITATLLLLLVGTNIYFALEIVKLKSQTASSQNNSMQFDIIIATVIARKL